MTNNPQASQQVPSGMTDADKVRIAAECGVFCTMPQAVAFADRVLAAQPSQAGGDALTDGHKEPVWQKGYTSGYNDGVQDGKRTSGGDGAKDANDVPYPFLPSGFTIIRDDEDGYMVLKNGGGRNFGFLPTRQAATAMAWALYAADLASVAHAASKEEELRNEPKVGEQWYVKLPGQHELVLRIVDKITDKIVVLSYVKEKWSTGEYIRYPATYEREYVDLVESYFSSLNRAAIAAGKHKGE